MLAKRKIFAKSSNSDEKPKFWSKKKIVDQKLKFRAQNANFDIKKMYFKL